MIVINISACYQSSTTVYITATISPSATPTNLPLPTGTAIPGKTPTPQDDLITKNCVNVLPTAPANFMTMGIIPLEDYQTWRIVFLNIESGYTAKIPGMEKYIDAFAVSPDRKTLAYKKYEDGSYLLILRDAINNHHKVALMRQDDFALGNWLDNQQLLLGKDGKFVVFNPYTREEKSYSIDDFPGYDTDNWRNYWVGFDPTAKRAIYKNGFAFLLDLDSKQIIAKVTDGFDRTPVAKWTLDGNEAAIVGTTVVGKNGHGIGDDIFGVSRDGQVTQLTYLSEYFGAWLNIHSLSWSPDSRYIAFWMRLPGSSQWQLAVVDSLTKKVTDYCISTDPYATNNRKSLPALSAPLWSPDGKQIIVEHRTNDSKYVVLLDIKQNIAFQIAQNAYPAGWMTVEP